ncbi:MAG: hypothetical protein ACRCR9_00020 [Chitinophagaceae bacterium]
MIKKTLFSIVVILSLFVISCTKNLDGITDFNNWEVEWTPHFGIPVLNANISYNDLRQIIPTDNSFTVSEGNDNILVVNVKQNIISALDDVLELQNFNHSFDLPLIGGDDPSLQLTEQLPINKLINLQEVNGTIKSITFNEGVIFLNIIGNGVNNISSISASLGDLRSEEIYPKNSHNVIVPIHLKDKMIKVAKDNITLEIRINKKPNTSPFNADISLNSENLDLNAIDIENFEYSQSIEKTLSMNFFENINNQHPDFLLKFVDPVKLRVNFKNESGLKVELTNLKAIYHYKNNSSPEEQTLDITTTSTQTYKEFTITDISNLLTQIVFTTDAQLSASEPNTTTTISKAKNVELNGSVTIPLNVNIQNLSYERTLALPKITDTKILDALEELTIKTFSNNGFPVALKCTLKAIDENGESIRTIDLGKIITSKNANTVILLDKKIIKDLISTGKGKIILGLATYDTNGQPGAGKFTTKDKLSLKIGISIQANGKQIL